MRASFIALLVTLCTLASAQPLDFLAPPHQWQAKADNAAGSQMTLQPSFEAPLW